MTATRAFQTFCIASATALNQMQILPQHEAIVIHEPPLLALDNHGFVSRTTANVVL